ncbi:hypothetical protein MKY15_19670 [Sporosarcina sp. FSL K6-1540]|uniref:hypothetical protein n=1 Tax=Sporosarcina sp. FSL K6-1540 TaxID=2921555 RepID=UPI00315A1021
MKKFVTTILFSLLVLGITQTTSANEVSEQEDFEAMKKAFATTKLTMDAENPETVEEKIYDENGEYVGTMGMEFVEFTPDGLYHPEIGTRGTLSTGTNKIKVYWYSVLTNYHFYADIKKGTGITDTITRVYDEWFLISPPLSFTSDSLQILRSTNSVTTPAEARYTINYSTAFGGSTKMWIYITAGKGLYQTGHN